ncbi:CoxG family protein [Paraburkholderia caballeronis]|uniref:Carbon monoxide dehydrogenase subunit G n=1 Tax=Paraburkholderia caballeronis TaxID=416943 RepID=A0A1H7HGP7_9BURK|nr:carbon monoxide dehydrogenase subunit G [Paraburkholderia caballeronis]PXW29511.1 hypothetical protein C7403_101365 [Paraburkholderia caballeronis]PXX04770.1 hypothetical protein C7407_101365 [Paraburkholderia caballeronis]RAK05831.1 hypothetical protein C7409_101365 [Paraburkholderia caballeronis]SEB41603.1 hypothetical protein SAMN05445871_0039 [Paraburkholderia caballeronis]SEK49459.1 hypothetical protein SAMN05192542_102270 [Paraburkholderia caballeronis]
MELTESCTLPVPQQRAWDALNDTTILRASIPGCDSIEAEGGNAYALSMSASVGPVKARFNGRMRLTDVDAPRAYTIVFEGQGGAAGFGKGHARVTLEPDGDAATKRSYAASAQVGGKLAQIGSRLVDGAARRRRDATCKLAREFFRRFGEQPGGAAEVADDAGRSGAAPDTPTATAADAAGNGAARNETTADGDASGDGQQRRKRSWTAWISKS